MFGSAMGFLASRPLRPARPPSQLLNGVMFDCDCNGDTEGSISKPRMMEAKTSATRQQSRLYPLRNLLGKYFDNFNDSAEGLPAISCGMSAAGDLEEKLRVNVVYIWRKFDNRKFHRTGDGFAMDHDVLPIPWLNSLIDDTIAVGLKATRPK
jgi:hypothetical protein